MVGGGWGGGIAASNARRHLLKWEDLIFCQFEVIFISLFVIFLLVNTGICRACSWHNPSQTGKLELPSCSCAGKTGLPKQSCKFKKFWSNLEGFQLKGFGGEILLINCVCCAHTEHALDFGTNVTCMSE